MIWGFPEIGVPRFIIHLNGIFHYKPSSYWVPGFMETPFMEYTCHLTSTDIVGYPTRLEHWNIANKWWEKKTSEVYASMGYTPESLHGTPNKWHLEDCHFGVYVAIFLAFNHQYVSVLFWLKLFWNWKWVYIKTNIAMGKTRPFFWLN